MENAKALRSAACGYIILSALLCVLGIVLIVHPALSASVLCRIGGVLFIAFGGVKILGYFSKDLYRLAFQHDLAFGILLIVLGILLLLRTQVVVHAVCILLGLSVLADALLKVQIAIDAKAFGLARWHLILIAALGTAAVGFFLLLRPSESSAVMAALLGLTLLCEGILSLTTVLTAVKLMR